MGKLTAEQIMDGIAEMTVLEVSDLVKAMEDNPDIRVANGIAAIPNVESTVFPASEPRRSAPVAHHDLVPVEER